MNLNLISKYKTELMGICATGVILCHAAPGGVVLPCWIMKLFGLGQLGTSGFLFLSGMGMWFSLNKYDGSIANWYKKRYKRILIPYSLMAIPFLIWEFINKGGSVANYLLKYCTINYWLKGEEFWFVAVLVVLYFIVPFWKLLIDRLGKYSSWLSLLVIISLLLINGRHFSEMSCFFVGFALSPLIKNNRSINVLLWSGVSVVLYITCLLVPKLGFFPRSFFLFIPIFFSFVILLSLLESSSNNNVLILLMHFMGEISFESYLSNVMLLSIFAYYFRGNSNLKYTLIILIGIIIAFIMHKISEKILHHI